MNRTIGVTIIILVLIASHAKAQSDAVGMMFYNVENLFYPGNDSTSDADDDFTPEGARRWTWNRYHNKITQLCKIILGINGWEPPDIICFCEIENRMVLETIIDHPLMLNFQYKAIHRDSPDHRNMDTGILYREKHLRLLNTGWIPIKDSNQMKRTREIQVAEFLTLGSGRVQDTLVCLMNHWSSKYGGAIESQPERMLQAKLLKDTIQQIHSAHPDKIIIIGGDFNENSESPACSQLVEMKNLQEIIPSPERGTYKYHGRWDRIDHVFVMDARLEYRYILSCWQHPFLFEPDKKYTGIKPRRTYSGYAYNGGISDHLPLLLKMQHR